MDDPPATISVKRAAQLLGMTDTNVRKLLGRGRLGGMKERGVWVVFAESVQARLQEREAATEKRRHGWHERLDAIADNWHGSKKGPEQTR